MLPQIAKVQEPINAAQQMVTRHVFIEAAVTALAAGEEGLGSGMVDSRCAVLPDRHAISTPRGHLREPRVFLAQAASADRWQAICVRRWSFDR